jgi:membrane-associated protein
VTGSHLLAVNFLSAHSLLASFGAIGVFLIMFAETGLLVGIFLPGDSLLFTAGLLCSTKVHDAVHLSLPAILLAAAAGALLGAQTGYLIGRTAGPPVLDRPERIRLRRAVSQARDYLERYGETKAVVIARFIPFVRTVINPVAGVVNMPQRQFVTAQVAGGLAWAIGVSLAGYALGSRIPSIDKYLLPIVAVVVVISLIPIALEIRRARQDNAETR